MILIDFGCCCNLSVVIVFVKDSSNRVLLGLPPMDCIFSCNSAGVKWISSNSEVRFAIDFTRYNACASSKIVSFNRLELRRAALSQLMEFVYPKAPPKRKNKNNTPNPTKLRIPVIHLLCLVLGVHSYVLVFSTFTKSQLKTILSAMPPIKYGIPWYSLIAVLIMAWISSCLPLISIAL